MSEPDPINTAILGAAGEHYVMCQLLRRGMIAALAPAGVPDADIIVSNRLGSSLAAVQVKTRRNVGKGGWVLKAKHETMKRHLLFLPSSISARHLRMRRSAGSFQARPWPKLLPRAMACGLPLQGGPAKRIRTATCAVSCTTIPIKGSIAAKGGSIHIVKLGILCLRLPQPQ